MKEGFTQEIEVNQEMIEIAEKFRERFENLRIKNLITMYLKLSQQKTQTGKLSTI